jgi:hypothetical protein
MSVVKRFSGTQKLRIISGNVSIYTTANKIREGVGDFAKFNSAAQQCLDALERTRSNDDYMSCASGLGACYEGIQVQIDMAV